MNTPPISESPTFFSAPNLGSFVRLHVIEGRVFPLRCRPILSALNGSMGLVVLGILLANAIGRPDPGLLSLLTIVALLLYGVGRVALRIHASKILSQARQQLKNLAPVRTTPGSDEQNRVEFWGDPDAVLRVLSLKQTTDAPESFDFERFAPKISVIFAPESVDLERYGPAISVIIAFVFADRFRDAIDKLGLSAVYGSCISRSLLGIIVTVMVVRGLWTSKRFRVQPGRIIEEKRARPFVGQARMTRQFTLVGKTIHIRGGAMTLAVCDPQKPSRGPTIDLKQFSNPLEFVCSVIRHAACDVPPADIADEKNIS